MTGHLDDAGETGRVSRVRVVTRSLFPVLVDARLLNMLAHRKCFRDGDDNSLGHLFRDRGDDRSEVDLDNDHGQTEKRATTLQ